MGKKEVEEGNLMDEIIRKLTAKYNQSKMMIPSKDEIEEEERKPFSWRRRHPEYFGEDELAKKKKNKEKLIRERIEKRKKFLALKKVI